METAKKLRQTREEKNETDLQKSGEQLASRTGVCTAARSGSV